VSTSNDFTATEYKVLRRVYANPKYGKRRPVLKPIVKRDEDARSKSESSKPVVGKESKPNLDNKATKHDPRPSFLEKLVDEPVDRTDKKPKNKEAQASDRNEEPSDKNNQKIKSEAEQKNLKKLEQKNKDKIVEKKPEEKPVVDNKAVKKETDPSKPAEKKPETVITKPEDSKKDTKKTEPLATEKNGVSKTVNALNTKGGLLDNILGEPKNMDKIVEKKPEEKPVVDNKAVKKEADPSKPAEKKPEAVVNNNNNKITPAPVITKPEDSKKDTKKTEPLATEKNEVAKTVNALNAKGGLLDNILGEPKNKDKIVEKKPEEKPVVDNKAVKKDADPSKPAEKKPEAVVNNNNNKITPAPVITKPEDSKKDIKKTEPLATEKNGVAKTVNANKLLDNILGKDKADKRTEDKKTEPTVENKTITKEADQPKPAEKKPEEKKIIPVVENKPAKNPAPTLTKSEETKKTEQVADEKKEKAKAKNEPIAENKTDRKNFNEAATEKKPVTKSVEGKNQESSTKKSEPIKNNNSPKKADVNDGGKALLANGDDKLGPVVHKKECYCRCCKSRTIKQQKKAADALKNDKKSSTACAIQ